MTLKRASTKARKPANTRSATADSPVEDVSEDCVSGSDSEEDARLSLRSDALDEESDDAEKIETRKKRPSRRVDASSSKRTQSSSSKHKPAAPRSTDPKSKRGVSEKGTPARKKRKVVEDNIAEGEGNSDVELKDGQEVVGKVVEAPTTGWGAHTAVSIENASS